MLTTQNDTFNVSVRTVVRNMHVMRHNYGFHCFSLHVPTYRFTECILPGSKVACSATNGVYFVMSATCLSLFLWMQRVGKCSTLSKMVRSSLPFSHPITEDWTTTMTQKESQLKKHCPQSTLALPAGRFRNSTRCFQLWTEPPGSALIVDVKLT